jgi:hypothetical protein
VESTRLSFAACADVEHGSSVSAEHFAERFAEELARREESEPRGRIAAETAATIASRRGFYEVRAAHSPDPPLVQQGFHCLDWFTKPILVSVILP